MMWRGFIASLFAVLVPTAALSSCQPQGFTWPEYAPNVSYNFLVEEQVAPPQTTLDDCPEVVGEIADGWWVFRWGPDRNPELTDTAIRNMLARLNRDTAYYRDVMGWPADKRALRGYRSAVYLFGSGLCTDNASNTEPGGWQGAIYHDGEDWPMVIASYYPIAAFDPDSRHYSEWQQGAMVHEAIHAILSSMTGARKAGWFHEGGNVWLQQTADARQSGDYSSMGFLNAADLIAPFIPIENYSGWLTDGSFGGPSAEGVNQYNEQGQQLCNWYPILGGKQYSSMFPTTLAQILGDGSVPWLWKYADNRILEGLGEGLGEEQTRRLIVEYRAKMALLDLGEWTQASINLMNGTVGNSWGVECEPSYRQPPEWKVTPYAATTRQGDVLVPEARTLPGWSGSNQIPLQVTGEKVTVDFQPIGDNMVCQLAYRTTEGTPVYGQYVSSGECSITLDEAPADDVVIAIITNTDYLYEGDQTRWAKYDYRLGLVEGVTGAADIHQKWYEAAALDDLTTVTFQGQVDGGGGTIQPAASGFLIDDVATITATPLPGYTFDGWTGAVVSSSPTVQLTMDTDKQLVARFRPCAGTC
jgi:hypothetical protein